VAFNVDAATGAAAQCVGSFVGQSFVSAGQLIAGYMVDKGYIKRGDQVLCPVESPDEEYAATLLPEAGSRLGAVYAADSFDHRRSHHLR
jgi:hypothetical protein